MNYSQTKYHLYLFYTKGQVEQIRKVYKRIEPGFWQLLKSFDTKYYSYGLIHQKSLTIEKVRKTIYNPEIKKGVSLFLDRITDEIKEAGYYIVDENYSKEVAPLFLFNVHLSPKANFGRKVLFYRNESEKIFSFFCIALDNRLFKNVSNEFKSLVESLFSDLNGVLGYEYDNVPYVYNGISNIEWAYKNIPASLEDGDIDKWQSNNGVRIKNNNLKT